MFNKRQNTPAGNRSWSRLVVSKGKWYLVSSLFTKGLGLLLLPVYTRYLTPSEFGLVNTLNSIAQFLPIILSLYLDSAFGRFFHDARDDREAMARLFSTIYWFVLAWGGIVLILVIVSGHYWIDLLVPESPYHYFVFAVFPTLFLQLGQLGVVFLRQNLETRLTTLLEISAAVGSAVVTILLLVVWQWGVLARLVGASVPAIILFVYFTRFFWKNSLLVGALDRKVLKECFLYSIPLLPNVAGGWVASLSDRLVIAKYADLAAVGLYSLAMTLGQTLYFLQDAITQVTGAVSMSSMVTDEATTKEKIADTSVKVWVLMLCANLSLTVFSPELVSLVAGKEYRDAAGMIGLVGLTYVFSAQYRIYSVFLSYRKKTWAISSGGIVMAAVSLLMNFMLVPTIGYYGAAWALLISVIFYTGWVLYWTNKYDRLTLKPGNYLLPFIFYVAATLMISISGTDPCTLSGLAIKGVILMLFMWAAWRSCFSARPA